MNEALSLDEVFGKRLLVVPDYQRGYAWERRQWQDLLDDLETLPPGRDHYTGTLVLNPQPGKRFTDEEGTVHDVVDVVDGQQRLTTLVILLTAIRRAMDVEPTLKAIAEGTRKRYLWVNDRNGIARSKLRLNRDSQDYFFRCVLADQHDVVPPSIASHAKLRDAKLFFAEYLAAEKEGRGDQFAEWIVALHAKVTDRLRLVLYTVDRAADVGVIFEVLNNRGRPLSELEKVKNYLLYLAAKLDVPESHDLDVLVNQSWTKVLERLMAAGLSRTEDEDQLLRSHWLMAYDHRPKHWEGARSVKDRFSLLRHAGNHVKLLQDLRIYVRTLEESAVAYADMMKPRRDGAFADFGAPMRSRAAALGEKLRRIGVEASFLPLYLAARLREKDGGRGYVELLSLCERFAFRVYRLGRARANTAQSSLYSIGADLYAELIDLPAALLLLRLLLREYSTTENFADALKQKPWYDNDWYHWAGLRYFLYEYEEHLADGHVVRLPWEHLEQHPDQTIEHILPQDPSHASGYWTTRFTADELKLLTHDLGNLCLTGDNSSYLNLPFPRKKGAPGDNRPCYAQSNVYQERALAAYDDWTPGSIDKRRADMVAWALRRWHVDDLPDATPMPDDEALIVPPDEAQ